MSINAILFTTKVSGLIIGEILYRMLKADRRGIYWKSGLAKIMMFSSSSLGASHRNMTISTWSMTRQR